jgi:hypothetical protein
LSWCCFIQEFAFGLCDGSCKICGARTWPGTGSLPKCSRCMLLVYCSRECQMGDWVEHKPFCDRAFQASSTASAAPTTASCQVCGIPSFSNSLVAKCSRCRSSSYCSKACQSKDWPNHRRSCNRVNEHSGNIAVQCLPALVDGLASVNSEPGTTAGAGVGARRLCPVCRGRAICCRMCMTVDEFRAAYIKLLNTHPDDLEIQPY